MRDSKNYVIAALCLVLCVMAVGFAAFSSTLNISSTAAISSNWQVQFATNTTEAKSATLDTGFTLPSSCVTTKATGGVDISNATLTVNATTFTMSAQLKQPGDTATCKAVIVNLGNIKAVVNKGAGQIVVKDDTDASVKFTYDIPADGEKLAVGATRVVSVTVTYDATATGNPAKDTYEFTASIPYVQDFSA